MNHFSAYFFGFLIVLAGNAAAQISGAVRVYTLPDGRFYSVDGVVYTAPTAQMWATGSKHVLSVDHMQETGAVKSRYKFQGWQYTGGELTTLPTVTVTADPSLKEYYAKFGVEHALSLNISLCKEPNCVTPGKVYVNDTAYTADADIWFGHGTQIKLMAEPAPGFAFEGWEGTSNQTIRGFLNMVELNSPTVVRPKFVLARPIHLTTEPAGLDVYADGGRVNTPIKLDWAYGTTHRLGVPSPQQARDGKFWLFSRWADGAAENRSYTVEPSREIQTFTAIFVPATTTDLWTSPAGLRLIVDGRDNWPGWIFPWGVGERHKIEAPEQQTDRQGRLWRFVSWSNGAPRAQEYQVPEGPHGQSTRLTAVYEPVARMTVTSAVSGLTVKVDGAECATPCEVQRAVGTALRLWAPASLPMGDLSRADFDGWPGSGSYAPEWSVTLKADPIALHLTYRTMHRLLASANPADGASWRMEPASPDGFYGAEETVTVTAVAQPGFRFRRWNGDASGSAPATNVAMSAPRAVEALMDRVPHISPAGVTNAAGGAPEGGVAPGSIVSIFGASFASETTAGPETPLAQAIGCITVRVGNRLMPLLFVSPSQINFHLPEDVPAGEHRVVVSCEGLPDTEAAFRAARNAPGLFEGAALHENGTPVTAESPARRGEMLTVYGTGFGPAQSPRPFGFAPPEASPMVDGVTVQAGDLTIAPERAFAVAGRAGLDALYFRVPESAASGALKVGVTVNGATSNTVSIAVQ